MMKKGFSILLSFILLASSVSLTIGTHYCGGKAVESMLMFGDDHLGCGMADMEESCGHSEKTNDKEVGFDNSPCCANEYFTVQVTDDFVKDTTPVNFRVNFVAAFISILLNQEILSKSTHKLFAGYYPPPPGKNLQVLLQTFLL
jgi:hypothetical protein